MSIEQPKPSAKSPSVWRWLFLVGLTTISTLFLTSIVQSFRGYDENDFYGYPYRASIGVSVFAFLLLIFFVASPFFVRRLGLLAVTTWFVALLALLWSARPRF